MTGTAEQHGRATEVTSPEVRRRLIRFFAREAHGRCEVLVAVLSGEAGPAGSQLPGAIADARLIRGSAEVADLRDIAAVAGQVERILKALHARRFAWNPALSAALRRGVNALLDLIEATEDWSERHAEVAQRVALELARYDVSPRKAQSEPVIPIGRLFHSDSGPHILFVPVNPQTEFEQQLRALAARGAAGGVVRTPPAVRSRRTRTPTAPRGQELRSLLDESVSRMSASFGGGTDSTVQIEELLYSGRAALARARELARRIHERGPENARELIPELIDLLDLAAKA